jgi:hypothetical protein
MVANAKQLNQIPWEAYGSRKRNRSIECAANKVLTTNIARQEHHSMALCSNDAKSCYDRILHAIATICMQRVGVHKEACLMMFGTPAKVKHHIRTTYGDSTTSYSCIELPFQGIYQGNGTGPGICLLVSILIINMLKTAGFGFRVRTAISQDEFSFVCYTLLTTVTLSIPASTPTLQKILPTWLPKCNKQSIHGKEASKPLEVRSSLPKVTGFSYTLFFRAIAGDMHASMRRQATLLSVIFLVRPEWSWIDWMFTKLKKHWEFSLP